MKKIFISGIAGFLGSHLANRMLAIGHEVTGCDNLIGGYLDNIHPDVKFYKYYCDNLELMTEITKDIDVIYHCAAMPHEGLSVFSPHLVTKNTFLTTSSLLSAAIKNNVKRFVFTSSMARYGTNKVPFTEDMAPRPQDPYGIAKYASELLIKNLAETHGMEYVIAVPHNIIGTKQKYDDPYRNVASIMINLMLQGKQPIIYGTGNQKRCFSFIQDNIQCLEKLAFQNNVNKQVINIGSDEEFVTIYNLACIIADILGFKLNPKYVPERPQEVYLANCSSDKARKMLGYKTNYTLRQGLQEIIAYIKKRGTKPFKYHLDIEIINDKVPSTWVDKLF